MAFLIFVCFSTILLSESFETIPVCEVDSKTFPPGPRPPEKKNTVWDVSIKLSNFLAFQ